MAYVVDAAALLSPPLLDQVIELLTPSWEQPLTTLRKGMADVDHVVVAERESQIVAFSSWRTERILDHQSHAWALAYVGLGSVRHDAKGVGVGKRCILETLARSYASLAAEHPDIPKSHRWLWTTTASPVSFLGLRKHCRDFVPVDNKASVQQFVDLIPLLHQIQGTQAGQTGDHALVSRGSSTLRYTSAETKRLESVDHRVQPE